MPRTGAGASGIHAGRVLAADLAAGWRGPLDVPDAAGLPGLLPRLPAGVRLPGGFVIAAMLHGASQRPVGTRHLHRWRINRGS